MVVTSYARQAFCLLEVSPEDIESVRRQLISYVSSQDVLVLIVSKVDDVAAR